MTSILRARAGERFAAIEKTRQRALNEQEETAQKISENTARLKALRLAKEATEMAASPTLKSGSKERAAKSLPS